MKYLKEYAHDKHVSDVSIKQERAVSPNLVIKEEPGASDVIANTTGNSLYRTVKENGIEILELLDDSDNNSEMDLAEDKGMSSDTLIGDLDIEMDSDDDEDRENSSTGMRSSSDSENDDSELEAASSNWLDHDNILSTVKQGPIKITRQCTVDAVEYISDLPSYWPVPKNKQAYVVDLSDQKFNVYDKKGKLMTVDALIKNAVSANFLLFHCGFNSLLFYLFIGTGLMDGLHWQWP